MSHEPEYVRGAKAAIHFDGKRCIHSRQCVLRQPAVFKANVEGAWIDPDAASPDALLEVAHNCPSGAITIERFDGGLQEARPAVNLITVRENGPLAFHADSQLEANRPDSGPRSVAAANRRPSRFATALMQQHNFRRPASHQRHQVSRLGLAMVL
jgi:uncharacterized Fe-S cluster protein YjdI